MTVSADAPVSRLSGLRESASTLRERDFRRWFLSQLLSASGASTQTVGQAWLVVQLHGGGEALALVTGSIFLPTLFFGAAFGALTDRFERRRLLLTTNALMVAVSATLAAVTAAGLTHIWLLVVFALVMGTVSAIDAPARQVYVLDLVGPHSVAGAISLNEVMLNASRVLGPALGGVLLAVFSVWVCFAANALSFVPVIVALLLITPKTQHTAPVRAASGGVKDGIRYAWGTPSIRACLFVAVAFGAVYNTGVVMPLLASQVFHLGGAGFGAMIATFGLGAVPGAVLSAAGGARPSGLNVLRLTLATGTAVLLCAFSPTLWLLFLSLALIGALSIWLIARANALVLLRADPVMRGRVMGVWSVALPGMNPVTGLAVGAAATAFGPRLAYAAVGIVTLAVAATSWRSLAGYLTPTTPAAQAIPTS